MSHLATLNPQSCDPQTTSTLFNSPIEIRRAIYIYLISTTGVHIVRTKKGNLQLSACVGPDRYADHTGSERRTSDDPSESEWIRRLESTWGPHWECEEIALSKDRDGDEESQTLHKCKVPECCPPRRERQEQQQPLSKRASQAAWRNNGGVLRVCKRMHFEAVDLMTELVCFTVTDLPTLDALLEIPGASPCGPSPSIPFGFKDSILPYITKLDITLSLPLPFFKVLDGSCITEDGSSTPVFEDDLKIWSKLPLNITHLKELCSLHIWLDHTNKAYWSVVNERAVLSGFESLASNPHLDLFFDLPKLHPELEDPQFHYIGEENTTDSSFTSLSTVKIHRILRQRYRGWKNCTGYHYTTLVRDFPESLGHYISYSLSIADMELWERAIWRSGENVRSFLGSLPRCYILDED